MKAILFETPPKEKAGRWGGGELHEDRAKETASGLQNHLELRLGISLNNGSDDTVATPTSDGRSRGGSRPSFFTTPDGLHLQAAETWLPQSRTGFIHPWSLAARQQKAVLEQAHHNPNPPPPPPSSTIPRTTHQQSFSPVVGWPPICAFRKNLVDPQSLKSEMDEEKDAKRVKLVEAEAIIKELEVKPTMFVKVNMEGCFVGRKIDLKAHDSYKSLFHALKKMFDNFLSINDSNNSNEEEQDEVASSDFILIYEDHEGDRMLVGDVPWKLFLASVKRLYIGHNPNAPNKVNGEVPGDQN
ncbi:auxin-responsive protein IAA25-like [Phoenix dactylifera]|uniref:Auxin-responsive protein n=1 Tax=Phoenix dactylifera TaxID=42345 RepID=A0A8B7BVV8_PHODC|nr:auxin-responsive protein IAA25-like [Phoenix dactylifera]